MYVILSSLFKITIAGLLTQLNKPAMVILNNVPINVCDT